ncbi:MFS transporter [Patescibacteria group bacterium]|nr:MFS transporter [Patescibacteria group bacterium]MBU0777437.1 MFS transporter [Patescibacteria group bacterium]MBU0846072.1 MFS transporter [Patescibacteria group bacterium]MBU0923125.1 MFS transporter [Patescibacteria group bacterium]MBU1066840.1 MFS transporter [Patescibacteria group bacterium]
MLTWHLPNNFNFFNYRKNELKPLLLSGVARRVAVTLISIFSPIYIYEIGQKYGLDSRYAIIVVLLYYVIAILSKTISLSFSENLSQKIGFKSMIWASFVPFVIFILSLVFTSLCPYLLIPAAIFWGIHVGFFWWGYHGYFIKEGDGDHFGLNIGEARFLETIVAVLSPFLGALLISFLGFNSLYIFSGVFMGIALLLLGKDHERRQRRDIKFSEVISLIKSHKSISLAYIGSSAETILYMVIWPVFLFRFFGQVISLGAVVSVSIFFAAIFSLVLGRWVDKQGERKIISIGVPLVTLSWIIRIIKKSLPIFILADSVWNFGQRMVELPLNTLTYKKGVEGGSARAILFRETAITIGGLLSLILLIVWMLYGGRLEEGFIIAAVLSTLPLIAVYKRKLQDK